MTGVFSILCPTSLISRGKTMWDDKTPHAITCARLLRMPPQRVYDELRDYGAHNNTGGWLFGGDRDLEQVLHGRADPLIDLGIAQFGVNQEVLSTLYERSFVNANDPQYSHAIRLAVLSNQGLARSSSFTQFPVDLADLIATDDQDRLHELRVLLQNPGAKAIVARLFNREPPFDQATSKRLSWMIECAAYNPCIKEDESNPDGPDLTAWSLQKGIWKLVQTMPLSDASIKALHHLLIMLDPRQTHTPDEDPIPVIERWQAVALDEQFKKFHANYFCTTLDYAVEFCCLAAALFGRRYDLATKHIVYAGAIDSPELTQRCAHYGHAVLTVEQMRYAHNKDATAFTLAALCNGQLIRNPKTRGEFENSTMLENSELWHLYHQRCQELLGLEQPDERRAMPPPPERVSLERIEAQLASLSTDLAQRLKAQSANTWWVLALLVAVLIAVSSRHF